MIREASSENVNLSIVVWLTDVDASLQTVFLTSTGREPMRDAPIDLPVAIARLGGDRGLLFDFARSVLEEVPTMREEIQSALSNEDFARAHLTAHGLKGMLATLEALPAAAAAGDVERLSHEHRLGEANDAVHRLCAELDRLTIALRSAAIAAE
jgi:HPt (histidine-containing phosphotransfer) domain-containing protein